MSGMQTDDSADIDRETQERREAEEANKRGAEDAKRAHFAERARMAREQMEEDQEHARERVEADLRRDRELMSKANRIARRYLGDLGDGLRRRELARDIVELVGDELDWQRERDGGEDNPMSGFLGTIAASAIGQALGNVVSRVAGKHVPGECKCDECRAKEAAARESGT